MRRYDSHDHPLDDSAGFDRPQALLEHSFEIISASRGGATLSFITLNQIPKLRSFLSFEDSLLINCKTFLATPSAVSPEESTAKASPALRKCAMSRSLSLLSRSFISLIVSARLTSRPAARNSWQRRRALSSMDASR